VELENKGGFSKHCRLEPVEPTSQHSTVSTDAALKSGYMRFWREYRRDSCWAMFKLKGQSFGEQLHHSRCSLALAAAPLPPLLQVVREGVKEGSNSQERIKGGVNCEWNSMHCSHVQANATFRTKQGTHHMGTGRCNRDSLGSRCQLVCVRV